MALASLVLRWRSLPALEAACWLLALLCLPAAFGARQAVRVAAPRLALQASYVYQEHELQTLRQTEFTRDPWGNPWRALVTPEDLDFEGMTEDELRFWGEFSEDGSVWSVQMRRIYSVGPNAIDERGRGDDVIMKNEAARLYGLNRHDPLVRFLAWTEAGSPVGLIAWSLELFLILGLGFGWCATASWQLRQPRNDLPAELGRALYLASVPGALTSAGVFWFVSAQSWASAAPMGNLQLLNAAGGGAVAALLACYLGSLWLRLRREPADPPGADSEASDDPTRSAEGSRPRGVAHLVLSLVLAVPGLGLVGLFLYAVLVFGHRIASLNDWGALLLFVYGGIGSSALSYSCLRRGRRMLRGPIA